MSILTRAQKRRYVERLQGYYGARCKVFMKGLAKEHVRVKEMTESSCADNAAAPGFRKWTQLQGDWESLWPRYMVLPILERWMREVFGNNARILHGDYPRQILDGQEYDEDFREQIDEFRGWFTINLFKGH